MASGKSIVLGYDRSPGAERARAVAVAEAAEVRVLVQVVDARPAAALIAGRRRARRAHDRRRRDVAPPSLPAADPPPATADARQTEPIDTVRAQEDPPTVATRADRHDTVTDLRKRQGPPPPGP